MDKNVVALIDALDLADECRNGSAVVDAVCHRCWYDVTVALEAVRKVHKPEPVQQVVVG